VPVQFKVTPLDYTPVVTLSQVVGVMVRVGGSKLIVGPHLRAPYHTAMELLPRLALGALAVNVSYDCS
jgi:hypothetical protein